MQGTGARAAGHHKRIQELLLFAQAIGSQVPAASARAVAATTGAQLNHCLSPRFLIAAGPHRRWSSSPLDLVAAGPGRRWSWSPLVLVAAGPGRRWSSSPLVLVAAGPRRRWSSSPLILVAAGPRRRWTRRRWSLCSPARARARRPDRHGAERKGEGQRKTTQRIHVIFLVGQEKGPLVARM